MANFWLGLGNVLTWVFLFALGVAWLTRYLDEKKIEGQTYSLVVLGVGGVIVAAGNVIGWVNVARLAVCFAVAAMPMGVEYFQRVIVAKGVELQVMEGWLDGNQGASREARIQGSDCRCEKCHAGNTDAIEEGDDAE